MVPLKQQNKKDYAQKHHKYETNRFYWTSDSFDLVSNEWSVINFVKLSLMTLIH